MSTERTNSTLNIQNLGERERGGREGERGRYILGHMVDTGSEVCGSVQLNRLYCFVIGFQDTINALTVGVVRVTILKRNQSP